MIGATVEPGPPAVDGEREVDPLEAGIGVEAGAGEDDREERHVDEPDRPAPDLLAHGEPDGGDAGGRVVAATTPEGVVALGTYTGLALKSVLAR